MDSIPAPKKVQPMKQNLATGSKTVPRSNTPDHGNNGRPSTVNKGRRIFESQFYLSQHPSNFQQSKKVFSTVQTDEEKKGRYRPKLNSYKREFAKPDYLHINVPKVQKQGDEQEARTSFPKAEEATIGKSMGTADSLLSKHNGWLSIDPKHSRKQAPETFQNTNPEQRNRLKPTWMKIAVNNSIEMSRYKKF